MGLTRNSEYLTNKYRYFLPPLSTQLPFSVQESITSAGSERRATMYPDCQEPPQSPAFHHQQQPQQQQQQQQCFNQSELTVHNNYFPPYIDSGYGYGLDNFGVTNVGTAVAMSLASMNTNMEGSSGREGEQLYEMSTAPMAQPNQLEQAQGDYLLNELLMNETQELPLMSIANAQTTESLQTYKMQGFHHPPQQQLETFPTSVYGNITQHHKEWEKLLPKPYHSDNLQQEDSTIYNTEGVKLDRCDRIPSPHHHTGQKKYNMYGKWRAGGDISGEKGFTIDGNDYSGENLNVHYAGSEEESCSSSERLSGTLYGESLEDKISRDEKKAQAMRLPLTTYEIISLPIDEFNEKLSKYELMESQLSLVRDIRRRGKNKVAAQNCRKRKLDQIYNLQKEVQSMQMEKNQLEMEQEQILRSLKHVDEKYRRLFQIVSVSRKNYPINSENG